MELNELREKLKGKVLVVTVGNPLRGDDGVGNFIYEKLKGKIHAPLINCEDSPEKFLDIIIKSKPDTIIIIDSVRTGSKAGTIFLVDEQEIFKLPLSTHRLPLSISIKYIKSQIPCQVQIIGIEPKNTEIGSKISKEVLISAEEIIDSLIKDLSKETTKA